MIKERGYEIVLQPEPKGGFSVFVPVIPSVATQGETIEEATEMAKEAIEAYLEVMGEDDLPSHRSSVQLECRWLPHQGAPTWIRILTAHLVQRRDLPSSIATCPRHAGISQAPELVPISRTDRKQ
jgi:antitoxin HicB